ncbi:uncharacterized protein PAC_12655 [Phialocephala subalpina]|uniref:Uncharacterized protein n=1 Tax=Phialocephala subalpina TaxID=576137 RepID=A0A1L7XCL6_9HELO|nr:uncharacterized protein PAC_12655 [Phialocephala subalpina]
MPSSLLISFSSSPASSTSAFRNTFDRTPGPIDRSPARRIPQSRTEFKTLKQIPPHIRQTVSDLNPAYKEVSKASAHADIIETDNGWALKSSSARSGEPWHDFVAEALQLRPWPAKGLPINQEDYSGLKVLETVLNSLPYSKQWLNRDEVLLGRVLQQPEEGGYHQALLFYTYGAPKDEKSELRSKCFGGFAEPLPSQKKNVALGRLPALRELVLVLTEAPAAGNKRKRQPSKKKALAKEKVIGNKRAKEV